MSCCKEKTASKHVDDKDVKSGMVKYGIEPGELIKEDEEEKHENKD